MTEQSNQSQELEASSEQVTPETKSGKSRHLIPTVLALAALGLGGYVWQQSQSLSKSFADLSKQNQQLHSATQQGLSQSRVDVHSFQHDISQLQKAQADAAEQFDALSTQIAAVKGQTQQSDDRWQILEVQYLLHLADYNLKFMHNVSQATHLLQAADRQLKTIAQSNLVPARRALAKDLAALKAYPQIDKAGMLSQLDALTTASKNLPLRTPKKPSEIKTETEVKAESKDTSKWKKAWHNSLSTLQKIVVIRHQQQPMQALMGPEQQQFLLHAIAYQLQQAQWALLNHDALIYQQSLKQVMDTVKDNFDLDKSATKAFVEQVQQLAATEVASSVPDINTSLSAIKQALQTSPQKKGAR